MLSYDKHKQNIMESLYLIWFVGYSYISWGLLCHNGIKTMLQYITPDPHSSEILL